jgi:hypothetical protein
LSRDELRSKGGLTVKKFKSQGIELLGELVESNELFLFVQANGYRYTLERAVTTVEEVDAADPVEKKPKKKRVGKPKKIEDAVSEL